MDLTRLRNTKISIIVPVTMMEGRLANLENWIKKEVSKEIDIVIVHDIQDTMTSLELQKILIPFVNIQFTEGKFGSPGEARNAGLELAFGDWIIFWDSDDIPDVEEVIVMVEQAAKKGKLIGIGGFTVESLDPRLLTTTHLLEESITGDLFDDIGMITCIPRWVFRREFIGKKRFLPFRMAEDQCFLFDLIPCPKDIYVHNKSVYTYCVGDMRQLTRNKNAISELLKSVSYLAKAMKNSDSLMSNWGALLLTRQVLTAIKRGNISTKIRMVILVINLIPLILFSKRESFSRAFRVLGTKRRLLIDKR